MLVCNGVGESASLADWEILVAVFGAVTWLVSATGELGDVGCTAKLVSFKKERPGVLSSTVSVEKLCTAVVMEGVTLGAMKSLVLAVDGENTSVACSVKDSLACVVPGGVDSTADVWLKPGFRLVDNSCSLLIIKVVVVGDCSGLNVTESGSLVDCASELTANDSSGVLTLREYSSGVLTDNSIEDCDRELPAKEDSSDVLTSVNSFVEEISSWYVVAVVCLSTSPLEEGSNWKEVVCSENEMRSVLDSSENEVTELSPSVALGLNVENNVSEEKMAIVVRCVPGNVESSSVALGKILTVCSEDS